LVYTASADLREQIKALGHAELKLDLLPDRSLTQVSKEVSHPRGTRSLSSHLKSRLGLEGVKMALLNELLSPLQLRDPLKLAEAIKALPISLTATRPIDEAISSAGGVAWDAMHAGHEIKVLPGVFCAGEMLDWEAPTGGYLLTASMATGVHAAKALHDKVKGDEP
jgi:predicted flavoprotein YhiN